MVSMAWSINFSASGRVTSSSAATAACNCAKSPAPLSGFSVASAASTLPGRRLDFLPVILAARSLAQAVSGVFGGR
jgi:hypothetical protein